MPLPVEEQGPHRHVNMKQSVQQLKTQTIYTILFQIVIAENAEIGLSALNSNYNHRQLYNCLQMVAL